MSALRQRMIKAMQMHGFSPRTHMSYLAAVRGLAKYTHRAPDTLDRTDLKGYFEYLVTERKLAPASVRLPSERTSRLVSPEIGARTSV